MTRLFISIFGPDGSGKSTQARILAGQLVLQGLDVQIVWIKSYHTLAYILSRIIGWLSPSSVSRNAYEHIIRIKPLCRNNMSKTLWSLIEFFSLIPLVLSRVYVPLLMGKIIIAERYLIDSIVSIAYALDDPEFNSKFIARLMLHFIPKNSILIHLDSDYKAVKERRKDLTDPENFFYFQREMYEKLSRSLKAVKIDTVENGIVETAGKIYKMVFQRI
jgi:thymidylate kinase